MITTKVRSIKTSKALMDHFEKFAKKQKPKETLNSMVVKLMARESKFKED